MAGAPKAGERSRGRRILRVLGAAGLGLLALVAIVLFGAWMWLRSEAGNQFLEDRIEAAVGGSLVAGSFGIGDLRTNVFDRVDVDDVVLAGPDGHEVVALEHAEVRLAPWALLGKHVSMPSVLVRGLSVDVRVDAQGTNSFHTLFGPPDPDAPPSSWEGLPVDLTAGLLTLEDVSLRWATPEQTWSVRNLDGQTTLQLRGERIAITDLALDARLVEPEQSDLVLRGEALYDGEQAYVRDLVLEALDSQVVANGRLEGLASGDLVADAHVALEPIDLERIDAWLGDPGLGGRWRGALEAVGPLSDLRVGGILTGVEDTRGKLQVHTRLDLEADDLPWQGTVHFTDFHAEDAYRPLRTMVEAIGEQTVLDGILVARGSGTSWPGSIVVQGAYDGSEQRVFDLPFSSVDFEFGVADGVLTLPTVTTRGPLGALDVEGSVDIAGGPIDLRVQGTFDAAELRRFGAEDLGGRGRLDATIRGNFTDAAPVYRIRGPVSVQGFSYGDEVYFAGVEGQIRVAAGTDATEVNGEIEARGGTTYGVVVDAVSEPALRVWVPYDDEVEVTGSGSVEGVRIESVFDLTTLQADWEVRVPTEGDQSVIATARIGPYSLLDTVSGDSGEASIDLVGDLLRFESVLREGDRRVVDTQGTYRLDTSAIRMPRLRISPVEGRSYREARPLEFVVSEHGGVTDADIALLGEGGQRIELVGTLGLEGPVDATIDVQAFDLGLVADLYPDELGYLQGVVDLDIGLTGQASEAVLTGHVAAEGIWLEGQTRSLAVAGDLVGTGRTLEVDLRADLGAEPLAVARGTVPLLLDLAEPGIDPDGTVRLDVHLRPGPAERLQQFADLGLPPGELSAALVLDGAIRDPDLEVAAVMVSDVEGWDAPARTEFVLVREGDQLSWWGDVLEGYTRRATVDGRGTNHWDRVFAWALGEGAEPDLSDYGLWVDRMTTDLQLLGLPVGDLARLAGYDIDLQGELRGGFRISGSAATPVVQGKVEWIDAQVGDVVFHGGYLEVEPKQGGYTVDLRLLSDEGSLTMAGDVPVYIDLRKDPRSWAAGALALDLQGAGLPLSAVASLVPGVSEASGSLTLRGHVQGSAIDPEPDLMVEIEDGRVAYLGTGVDYREIYLLARLSQDEVDLREFHARTQPIRASAALAQGALVGGDLFQAKDQLAIEASGRAGLANWTPTDVEGTVTLDRMWVLATADQQILLSGDASLSGSWPAIQVASSLALDDGFVAIDRAAFLSLGPLEIDDGLVIHRADHDLSERVAAGDPRPPFYQDFDVDVAVDLQRALELEIGFPFLTDYGEFGASLTTAKMQSRLGGTVDVGMAQGELKVEGAVEVLDGKVQVLGSNFALRQGTVTFLGSPSNPLLDVTARMPVGTTYLEMMVQGSADSPEIHLSSPDYQSQTQIMTMLVTGQEPQDLSPEQGAQSEQFLTSLLLGSVLGGAKISALSVDPDGTVRVGLPVFRRVYAEGVYRIDPQLDENAYAVDFEWQIAQRLVLDGAFGNRKSWLDLFWEYRF